MGKARTHTWQRAPPKEGGSGIPKTGTVLYYNRGNAKSRGSLNRNHHHGRFSSAKSWGKDGTTSLE